MRVEKETQADPEDAGLGTVPGGGSPAAGPDRQSAAGQQHDLPETEKAPEVTERKSSRTGRNLPAAIGVGLGMGGLVVLTLFTVKATFLLYVGIIVAAALWELSGALRSRDIHLPLVPDRGRRYRDGHAGLLDAGQVGAGRSRSDRDRRARLAAARRGGRLRPGRDRRYLHAHLPAAGGRFRCPDAG